MTCYRCHAWPCICADGVTLIHGDCREVLPELEAGSVDVILTDPPWELSKHSIEIRGKGVGPRRQKSFTLQAGAVGEWDEDVLRQCQDIAAYDCFILAGYRELGKLCLRMEPLRGVFAWHKPNAAPAAFYPAKPDLSFIVWGGRKSLLYGRQHWPSMVFSVPFPNAGCVKSERLCDPSGKAIHPCQGPKRLYRELVRPLPEEARILDCYAGTGTTGRACKDLGRKCILIEIEEKYCRIAAERLRQEVLF